jgi:hypothetical protein
MASPDKNNWTTSLRPESLRMALREQYHVAVGFPFTQLREPKQVPHYLRRHMAEKVQVASGHLE